MNGQAPQQPPGFEHNEQMEEHARQRALQQQRQDLEAQRDRDREYGERQERDRQQREQYGGPPPHQNNTGSITIHQPVASRLPGAIHSPGGLLANHGGPPPSVPLGAPSGPGNAFGGPLHNESSRALQHNTQSTASQLQQGHGFGGPNILNHNAAPPSVPHGPSSVAGLAFGASLQQQQQQEALRSLPFGPPATPVHQIPGAPAMGQGGQQPILNDALSYLDQVKVQFVDQPDVYNRFLDIMKDFKSQAIDTPGVINRVSELFAGHPNLIQGFNTFLPPGYRIECGTGSDPNTIRVTTPMGTTIQSMSGGAGAGGPFMQHHQRPGGWQQINSIESPEAVFSPQNQNSGPAYSQLQNQASYEAQQAAAAAAHQQQQRGVNQLTNAVATLGGPRNAQTPVPMNGSDLQAGNEKRGPVEFNHAISYVNKIKNRFQDRPEIYKNFLEILQTYQRESKPIQDVYAQVTKLFDSAPDLLEDFKQFLPESAAQAKAAAAAKAAEEVAAMAGNAQTPQASHRTGGGMPPVGNFAVPASTGKENKKRPRGNAPNAAGTNAESSRPIIGAKRAKLSHKPNGGDALEVSPTLTPVVPEPLAPTTSSGANQDELAFFDRVKKFIANKTVMNEFLKLCNLFSQDLIDRNVLVSKVSGFIGGNPDLMQYFKTLVAYDGEEEVVDNTPKVPSGKVSLSNCRALGPSYRLLPTRERMKPCSGRDEMCQAVLNDNWASHPTWASEDSGFVAHRKNIFEESLHRIEEERHDYDFNIEANAKVIQLLEPYAQQILALSALERAGYRLQPGLGGSSTTIYKRVLKKVYGDQGPKVCEDLFRDPCAVLPVVLARLKQKDEEWRFTQREWDKVWHAQTQNMYLKSLDHMGIQAKSADKKNFSTKHLIDAIKTKYEEQRKQSKKPHPQAVQFSFEFKDQDVILDVLYFMTLFVYNSNQHNTAEQRRIAEFFTRFVTTFFSIPLEVAIERTKMIDRGTPDEDEDSVVPDVPNGRGKKIANGKKNNDLRRGVLDRGRNGTKARGQKEESVTGSKESTPDVESVGEDDLGESVDDGINSEATNDRWTRSHFAPTAANGTTPLDPEELKVSHDDPLPRTDWKLYSNQTIFVFFSIFQALCERFKELKDSEDEAKAGAKRFTVHKPARDIGLMDDRNDQYWIIDKSSSYYAKTLELVEDLVAGDLEEAKYQDILRHYYLQKGWKLYTVADNLKQLCKLGATCSSADGKEKTVELLELFWRDRELDEASVNDDLRVRRQADKYIKEGEMFVINWSPANKAATIRWLQKFEPTYDQAGLNKMDAWKYYVSSYFHVEPTEGVNRNAIRNPVLARNQKIWDAESEDGSGSREPVSFKEGLGAKICVNTYKLFYDQNTSDWFVYTDKPFEGARERLQKVEDARNQRFREKFVMNSSWMKDMTHDQVQQATADFKKWMDEGVIPGSAPAAEQVAASA
ncbi:hypothetical protein B0O99DRAFT_619426 [Bisporella sp. PMI_857]|nr:hypothetical protein B0O99DRAFT_619426 [Bisporella sp. PMI_857]